MILKLDLYNLSILVSIIQACRSYKLSNSNSTWKDLNKDDKCEVATPRIQYDNKKLTIDTRGQKFTEEAWVGYYKQSEYFRYIGCSSSSGFNTATKHLGVPTPGRCYSACSHTPYIGLENRNKCHCLQTKPTGNLTGQGCNSICDITSNVVCGGHNFTSLYKKLPSDVFPKDRIRTSSKAEVKNCLIININKTKEIYYEWVSCSKPIFVLCSSESDQSVVLHRQSKPWKHAASLCFLYRTFPIGFEDVSKIKNEKGFAWTGIIRSDVIYNNTGHWKTHSDTAYGYVQYDNSLQNTILNFTKEDKEKRVLCNAEIPVNRQPTKTMSKIPLPNTTKVSVTINDRLQNTNAGSSTKSGTNVTVVVGASVPALLIVVAMVIILIIIKRKKILCFAERKQSSCGADRDNKKNTNHVTHVNPSYDLVDIEHIDETDKPVANTYEDTYNVTLGEKDDKSTYESTYDTACTDCEGDGKDVNEATYEVADIDAETDEDEENICKTTYDTTANENDNIYNKLQSEDNLYDHTDNKSKNRIQTSDDTYNTAREALVDSTCTKGGHSGVMNTMEESVYNSTNSDPSHLKQTDNVYNTFEK